MTSKRVGHGLKWAVCSALLSAGTIAAAAPRDLNAVSTARLANVESSEAVIIENSASPKMHPSLVGVSGRQTILVRLKGDAVAKAYSTSTRASVAAEQAAFIDRALGVAPSAEVVASLQLVLNAVVLNVDAADLPALSRDTSISRLVGVANYEQDLSQTVPYIGGSTAHALGATGKGIRVAVIDSGVDYTHAALGGPGTQAAYEAAWAPLPLAPPAIPAVPAGTGYLAADAPGAADDGLFPSAKVIGGYDFVGESWPNTGLLPDNDPIGAPDATTFGGHGTHVADIIAGKLGVAPDAKLYALKACSAPTSSCSGVALMQSMEFAVDPNGDGDTADDHVDLINMSLGSVYGQPFDDDLSAAVDAAFDAGVLTIASAGNSADKQFITGSPAAASSALSVAQTAVPSASLQLMTLLAPVTGNRGAVFQPWSTPLTTTIEGPVFYPPTTGGRRIGCADAAGTNPYAPGELAGRIVLVDRGTCSFSLKIANIAAAGGSLGIIGLITADAPFGGAFGGGVQTIPGFMINQADANILRAGNAVVRFSPDGVLSLAGSLASTSSRGPRFDDNIVKPEIGAPGASVSAMSGSFTGTAAFGGTSGAAPMVTGAAALLLEARGWCLNIGQIKQILVNTGETNVFQPSAAASVFPDQLAPITRIGGGEVRVDRAMVSPLVVSDNTGDDVSFVHGAMSFGYLDASKPTTVLNRKLKLENVSNTSQSYSIAPTLRFADDANGAVTMTVTPSSITLAPYQTREVKVKLVVDATKLRLNLMNASTGGNAIGPLTANEYDGYVVFTGKDHKASMPWHILPRKSADVSAWLPTQHLHVDPTTGTGTFPILNKGVGDAQVFAYATLGQGHDRPAGARGEQAPTPDIRAVGTNTFLAPAGFCTADTNFIWEFAFSTFERPANPQGIWYEVDIDTNNDGNTDFFVYTRDVSGDTTLSDGRVATAVFNTATGTTLLRSNFFFMEHATNSSTLVMRICGSDLGLGLADIGRPMVADFRVTSWYWGTPESHLGPFLITPLGEEFTASVPGDVVSYQQKTNGNVQQWDPFPGLSPYTGLMLITNSAFSATNNGGSTGASEAILLQR
jgi:minor extracellular serine protease Vpr